MRACGGAHERPCSRYAGDRFGRRAAVRAAAAPLVPRERARPAVAEDARPVSRARLRADAAADAGLARRHALRRIPRGLPHPARCRACEATSCDGGVGGARLLRAGAEPPRAGAPRDRPRPRRRGGAAGRRRRAAHAARDRRVHRRCGELVRVRAARRARGHQRRAGAEARLRAGDRPQVGTRTETRVADRTRAAAAYGFRHMDPQSGAHGARRPGVHGARGALCGMPGARAVRLGAQRRTASFFATL